MDHTLLNCDPSRVLKVHIVQKIPQKHTLHFLNHHHLVSYGFTVEFMRDGDGAESTERSAVYRLVFKNGITDSKNPSQLSDAVTIKVSSQITLIHPTFLECVFRIHIFRLPCA